MEYSEALEDIVAGANVAGYLEAEEKIFIDSDMELTLYLCKLYNSWCCVSGDGENFVEYVARKLVEDFSVSADGNDPCVLASGARSRES